MSGTISYTQPGTLNRLLTQLTLASYPALNVTSGYFGKSFMASSFSGAPVSQQPTGTGLVNSPEPYIMGSFAFGILRTQPLAGAWLSQVQLYSVLGTVTGYPDSAAFPAIQLVNASITSFDPGGWDGSDATVNVTISGLFYTNSAAWS
jgi:hypothetical protein